MQIEIFDVGHGGCAMVTCPNGAKIMLDCGFRTEPNFFPSVKYYGQFIDLLALLNLDEDHLDDLPYVWKNVRIGSIYSNPSVNAAALAMMKKEGGMDDGVRHAHAVLNHFGSGMIGTPGNFGDVRAWAYHNRYGQPHTDTNNLSLAVFIRYGAFTILFAGDLEKAGWESLLQIPGFAADLASVTVFVASHHGRENGCCEQVFQYAYPEVFIFSDDERKFGTQETDGWYRNRAKGIVDLDTVRSIFDYQKRYVLTTRKDGTLTMQVKPDGTYLVTPERRDFSALIAAALSGRYGLSSISA